jgi:hypothetical protein
MTRILTIIVLLVAAPAWGQGLSRADEDRIRGKEYFAFPDYRKDCVFLLERGGNELGCIKLPEIARLGLRTKTYEVVSYMNREDRYNFLVEKKYLSIEKQKLLYGYKANILRYLKATKKTPEELADEKRRRQAQEAKEKKKAKLAAEQQAFITEKARLAALREEERGEELVVVGSGSAFSINSEGFLISNNHVIDKCAKFSVIASGQESNAEILAVDRRNDLALIKIDIDTPLFFYIKKDAPALTKSIFVGGFPFGDALNSKVKVTKGIVSSLAGLDNNFSNFMMDAPIQPGNSGGPVFGEDGQVVGVAVAKLDVKAIFNMFEVIPEGTNFAVKNTVLREFLNANQVNVPDAPFFSFGVETSELINNGIFHVLCSVKRKDIPELKEHKVLFEKY